MKKYNYFSRIYLSISSAEFYNHIIKEPLYKALLFLLFYSAIISVPFGIYSTINYNANITTITDIIGSETFPDFTITNDGVDIAASTPYVYEKNSSIIIIDSTDKYTKNSISNYYFGLLINSDGIYFASYSNPIKFTNFFWSSYTLTKDDLVNSYLVMKPLILIVFLFIEILLAIVGAFFQSVIAYSIASITRVIMGVHLSPKQIYAMAIYSLVIPIIVNRALYVLSTPITLGPLLITYIISAMFVVRALRNIKQQG